MNSTIETLLTKVSELNRKYEEEAKKTGERFNIFSILGAESAETSTHSAFLVELLNPRGSHGRGGLFLELFIKIIKHNFPDTPMPDFEMENTIVEKEWHLGLINENYTEGGRADIVLNGLNGAICIENKIYAGDQENQLIRYRTHYAGVNDLILYLNLFGDPPSEVSIKSGSHTLVDGADFLVISYSKHILDWLVQCQNEAQNIPIREAIGQYIQLIKKLTGNDMGKEQQDEFIKLIAGKPEFIEGAYQIHTNWEKIKLEIFEDLSKNIRTTLKNNIPIKIEFDCGFGLKDTGFKINAETWIYEIGFSVDDSASNAVSIGVKTKDHLLIQSNIGKSIAEKLNSLPFGKEWKSDNWCWLRDCSKEWDQMGWSEIPTKGSALIIVMVRDIIERLDGIGQVNASLGSQTESADQ